MQIFRGESDPDALLTADDETALAAQIEAGVLAAEALRIGEHPSGASRAELRLLAEIGELARQRYIVANLRLVAMVAGQFAARSRLAEADLFQEGCLGLMSAVARFDWRRGCRFSTYALFWIRAYVGSAAARMLGGLNLPASRASQLRAARGVEVALSQSLGRAPTAAEVGVALGRTEQWTSELLAHSAPQSLQLEDVETAMVQAAELDRVLDADRPGAELLEFLPELERRILELRLGFASEVPYGYADVSRMLGISVTRIRRVEQRALELLRAVCPHQARVHL